MWGTSKDFLEKASNSTESNPSLANVTALKEKGNKAGERAQQWRPLDALPEHPSLIPNRNKFFSKDK